MRVAMDPSRNEALEPSELVTSVSCPSGSSAGAAAEGIA
jgi:hypothetical protein